MAHFGGHHRIVAARGRKGNWGGVRHGVRGGNPRSFKCMMCHGVIELHSKWDSGGICDRCRAELGWHVVYDRERGVGALPANLRAAYGG